MRRPATAAEVERDIKMARECLVAAHFKVLQPERYLLLGNYEASKERKTSLIQIESSKIE